MSDTFIVLSRTQYPWLVYAAEPVLSNGLPASRSVAQNITLQGVKCFYKTFYYALQDQNKLDLILELSAPAYTDSIMFEQVSAAGQLLQTPARIKVISNDPIYHQPINDPGAGITYWRVKIKLRNGSILYTGTISVLTSGRRYIIFYPNPADRNTPLAWVLRQNLPADSRLQLYDISGRLVRSYPEIPNNINLQTLAPGMLIYKLVSNGNQLLETGKLIIR